MNLPEDRSKFSDVDATLDPARFIDYLDAARKALPVIETKAWITDQLRLRAGLSALDVGCGTGEDVVSMAECVGDSGTAVGIDASAAMIAEAKSRHGDIANVAFRVADAHVLPYDDASFDGCRAERTLQHVADPCQVVGEMARVLIPDGRIVLSEPDWETLVIDGSDPALSARIIGAHIKRHAQPTIGRRLPGLLTSHEMSDIEVASGVVIIRDLQQARRAFGIPADLSATVAAGVITDREAQQWFADLERSHSEGRFLVAVTGFRAAGTKSLPTGPMAGDPDGPAVRGTADEPSISIDH